MRRRFFADGIEAGRAVVRGQTAAHLARVLRAQPGQEYELAREGQAFLGRIASVSARQVDFDIVAALPQSDPGPRIELAAAIFKFDRFEWMLEKATELGLRRLHLLSTRRTDPRLLAAAPKRLERWRAIVIEAAQQSRRADWPGIAPPQPLAEYLAHPPEGRRVLLSEEPGGAPLEATPAHEPLTLLAGPEGGFAAEEFAAAHLAGFTPVSLGPRILRCETAILAALARLG